MGGPVPPRPPKCALMGAFHEVVRLGVVVFGLGFLWVLVRAFCGGTKSPQAPPEMRPNGRIS